MDESSRKGKEPKMFEAMDAKGPKWCNHPIQLPVGCNTRDLRSSERRTEPLKPPSGFHFAPSDEELAFRYLLRKKLSNSVPYDGIRDAFVYETPPERLVQMYEKWGADGKWYFFTTRDRKYPNGTRPARHTHDGAGYWKATGSDKLMQCPGNYFALRKTLVYHLGNYPNGTRTNWVMTEIVLTDANKMPVYRFSLCTITRKKEDGRRRRRRRRNNDDEASSSNQVPEMLQIVPLEYNQEVNHV